MDDELTHVPGSTVRQRRLPQVELGGTEPWERQERETDQAWAAFCAWRDLDGKRTLLRAARKVGKSEITLAGWSTQWGWQDRVRAKELEDDRQLRDAMMAELTTMARRHAQVASAGIQAMSWPIRELVQRMSDPERRAEFEAMKTPALVALVRDCAGAIRQLVDVERLSRGASTENIAVVQSTIDEADVAHLMEDPEVARLASQLFARVSGERAATVIDAHANGAGVGEADAGGAGEAGTGTELADAPAHRATEPRTD